MIENTTQTVAATYGEPRRRQLLESFHGKLAAVTIGPAYKAALFLAALAMILLPLIYLALIGVASYATYWHAMENVTILEQMGSKRIALLAYLAPLITGAILVFFLIKPLLTPRPAERPIRSLSPEEEPLLHELVEKLCASVGAPMPSRIDADCRVNASAHLRRGFRSFFGKSDLVLTIGLPLAEGLRLDQLAGVLAHELGHFAQGAGMRLTFLVRRVNLWFDRVVNGRDRWDAQLEEASRSDSGWVALVARLAQGAVWTSRKILAGLMYLGHAISCNLMRQMEFDADRYAVRLVGAPVFASTCHELSYLDAAFERSLGELSLSWRDGRLADSLPRMTLHHRRTLPGAELDQLAAAIGQSKTSWNDTHPADSERLAAARREPAPPIFHSGLPATALFRDFSRLSREVTRTFYEVELDLTVAANALRSADELFSHHQEARAGRLALRRLLRAEYDVFEPPPLAEPLPAADRSCAAARLAQLRRAQLDEDPCLQTTWEAFDRATGRHLEVGAGETLIESGYRLNAGAYGLQDPTAAGLAARRLELDFELTQLRHTLEPALAQAGERAALALAQRGGSDELAALRAAAGALGGQRDRLQRIRTTVTRIRNLANWRAAAGDNDSDKPGRRLEELIGSLAAELGSLRLALAGVPRPSADAREAESLGTHLVPQLPEAGDGQAIFDLGRRALERSALTGSRIWGRLAALAEAAEADLGLGPLELEEPRRQAA